MNSTKNFDLHYECKGRQWTKKQPQQLEIRCIHKHLIGLKLKNRLCSTLNISGLCCVVWRRFCFSTSIPFPILPYFCPSKRSKRNCSVICTVLIVYAVFFLFANAKQIFYIISDPYHKMTGNHLHLHSC